MFVESTTFRMCRGGRANTRCCSLVGSCEWHGTTSSCGPPPDRDWCARASSTALISAMPGRKTSTADASSAPSAPPPPPPLLSGSLTHSHRTMAAMANSSTSSFSIDRSPAMARSSHRTSRSTISSHSSTARRDSGSPPRFGGPPLPRGRCSAPTFTWDRMSSRKYLGGREGGRGERGGGGGRTRIYSARTPGPRAACPGTRPPGPGWARTARPGGAA